MAATSPRTPASLAGGGLGEQRWRALGAFAAIYLVWGSTFYAVRVAVRELPPLLAAGARFAIAGALLYAWSLARREARITARELRNVCIVGALLFVPTYSALFWAETTIPSGLASVLTATLPLWTVLLEAGVFRLTRFSWLVLPPIALGVAGVALLVGGRGGAARLDQVACGAVLGAQVTWALGSVLARKLPLPRSGAVRAGAQMAFGGLLLLAASAAVGELAPWPHASRRALAAMAYLVVVAVLGHASYLWLLARLPATVVSSYTYVNPLVALLLGYALGDEALGARQLVGAVLVLGSVSAVLRVEPAAS